MTVGAVERSCPRCGTANRREHCFCMECGCSLADPTLESTRLDAGEPVVSAGPVEQTTSRIGEESGSPFETDLMDTLHGAGDGGADLGFEIHRDEIAALTDLLADIGVIPVPRNFEDLDFLCNQRREILAQISRLGREPVDQLEKAKLLLYVKEPAQAQRCAESAIEASYRSAVAYALRADSHYLQRNFRAALEDYGRAVTMKTDDPRLFNNRGVCYLHLGLERSAVAEFRRASDCRSDYALAAYNLSVTYGRMGMSAEAARVMREARQVDKDAKIHDEAARREPFRSYDILEEIGRGQFGRVYKARQTNLQRSVALKFLTPRVNLSLLEREARMTARLNHPRIVVIHELGTLYGMVFISMAYIEGKTLARHLEKGPLEPAWALRIAQQCSEALGCAHLEGVLHGDVKPSNIIVSADGNPVVMDFGLARELRPVGRSFEESFFAGKLAGTPAYMAPEIISDQGCPGRSADIWSLGVVLYQMLTGVVPFDDSNVLAVMRNVIEREPQVPSRVRQGLDPALDDLVMRALSKDPQRRFVEMHELSAALATARERLEGRPAPGDSRFAIDDLRSSHESGADHGMRMPTTENRESPEEVGGELLAPDRELPSPEAIGEDRNIRESQIANRNSVPARRFWQRPGLWLAVGLISLIVNILLVLLVVLKD